MAWALQSPPELTDAEFNRWQQLLEMRTGISFEKHKWILQSGLNQRMHEVGCCDYSDYYQQVSHGKNGALEWESLLKTLTVKETRFFRDIDAFECVRRHVVNLITRENSGRSIELWSVACSTGEEPYSLAMLTNDCIEGLYSNKFFGVTATDICLASLSEARKGAYLKRKVETIEPGIRARYFDETEKGYMIDPWIKQRICFVQANIIDLDNLPLGKMDIIFCQNVLIYFRTWRQKEVLDSLSTRLKPGGLLIVGSNEAVGWHNEQVERFQGGNVNAYVRKR